MNTRSRGVLAAMRDGGIGMPRTGKSGEREGGQIIVLFALSIVVMLVFAAIVVDLGVLRNNKQILVNSVDAAALAGGTVMPVDGSDLTLDANGKTPRQAAYDLIQSTLLANYGSLTGSQYQITFRCLIGIDKSSPPKPNVARDIPIVCDPSHSLGWTGSTTDAQKQSFFTGAGDTRSSSCDPFLGDKCNTVVVSASSNTNYSFGRVVGVNSGSTGAVQSAACNGPCGQPPNIPVDLVMIIDRTGSMLSPTDKTPATRDAAKAVLGVYDPTLQRVALGLLGPSSTTATCNGAGGPAVKAVLAQNFTTTAPTRSQDTSASNGANGATTLVINKPNGTTTDTFLIAGITVAGGIKIGAGAGTVVTPPAGWTLIRATTNATNVGMASYYKVAGASEPNSYTWTFNPTVRATGGIIQMSNVDINDPINVSAGAIGNDVSSPFRVIAPSVTTTTDKTGLVTFSGIKTAATFTPNTFTEQFDIQNSATTATATSMEGATDTLNTAGTTSATTNYATATAGGQYVAQLIALNPSPADYYGTDPTNPTDLSTWIPVGFTGTDVDSPAPAYNETYSDGNGNLNSASHIMSAINCFDAGLYTNLSTPIAMASYYLQHYGRPNVKWGIILETDGEPHYGSYGTAADYTCAAADAKATAAKGITNGNGDPIQIFTIGFGLDGSNNATCPDGSGFWQGKKATRLLASMATQPSSDQYGCPGNGSPNSNTDGDNFFCQPKSSDLTAVFSQVASQLAGIRTHLVQLYPAPIVTSLSSALGSHNGGLSITVTGKYFTGSTSVRMGGAAVPFTVNSDTSITISSTAPGTTGSTVDIVVTNGGGSSPIVNGDKYKYN